MDFSEQGSLGHWQQDADTFASWGVDYVRSITAAREPTPPATIICPKR